MGISKQKEEIPSTGGVHNTLASGTTVKGNISTDKDFRLDGSVEGDINCNGKIVIGPQGNVKGNIVSTNAEILGTIVGTIRIAEKLLLKSTAVIKGDIYTKILEIEPNAKFDGICKMTANAKENVADKPGK